MAQTNAADSEADALEVIAAERSARADDIRSIANGFTARRRVGHRSAMHIAALLKVQVDDLLEVAPEKRMETVACLRELRDHLERALGSAVVQWGLDHDSDHTERR